MQTIKTGVVIALLIAVCYGAFIALNAPEADIPDSIQEWVNETEADALSVEVDMGFDLGTATSVSPDSLLGEYSLPSNEPSGTFGTGDAASLPTVSLPEMPNSGNLAVSTPNLPEFPSTSDNQNGSNSAAPLQADSLAIDIDLPQAGTEGPSVPFNPDGSNVDSMKLVNTTIPTPAFPESNKTSPTLTPDNLAGAGQSSMQGSLPLLEASEPASGNSASNTAMPELPFAIARQQALMKADAGELKEALKLLTPFYNSPDMGFQEHEDLLDILDALSRHAIYSSSYMLEPAYTVGADETLASIAEKHNVTPELLSDINGLGGSRTLSPGTTLKVVNGPFRAEVQLRRRQLAIFLGGLYAGRFDIEVGSDPIPPPGIYEVDDRRRDRTYFAVGGAVIQANEPQNPYGGIWMSLGGNFSIHGSPAIDAAELEGAGCISLAPLDAQNLYNILTKHSQVEIKL